MLEACSDLKQCVVSQRAGRIPLGGRQEGFTGVFGLTEFHVDHADLKQCIVGQMAFGPTLRHLSGTR